MERDLVKFAGTRLIANGADRSIWRALVDLFPALEVLQLMMIMNDLLNDFKIALLTMQR